MLTIIASAFGGAVLTGLASFITYFFNGKREHKKWLNELKYKQYVSAIVDFEKLAQLLAGNDMSEKVVDEVYTLVHTFRSADLDLIGTKDVKQHHTTVLHSIHGLIAEAAKGPDTESFKTFDRALTVLITSMRKDLRVH